MLVDLFTSVDSYTRNLFSFSSDLAPDKFSLCHIPCCRTPFLQNHVGFAKKNSELCCDLSLPFDPLFPLVTHTALTNSIILRTVASSSVKFKHNSYVLLQEPTDQVRGPEQWHDIVHAVN